MARMLADWQRVFVNLVYSMQRLQELESVSLRLNYLEHYATDIHQKEHNRLLFYGEFYYESHWQYVPIEWRLINHHLYQKIGDSPAQILIKDLETWQLQDLNVDSGQTGVRVILVWRDKMHKLNAKIHRWPVDVILFSGLSGLSGS